MDTVTPEIRSKIMRKVRSKNTAPEIIVRSISHRLGFRFRLHRKDLPGKPDLTFPKLKSVIFVHGCFWHSHNCKAGQNKPKSNTEYWDNKLIRNKERDKANIIKIIALGWRPLIIWECETKDIKTLSTKIKKFLKNS